MQSCKLQWDECPVQAFPASSRTLHEEIGRAKSVMAKGAIEETRFMLFSVIEEHFQFKKKSKFKQRKKRTKSFSTKSTQQGGEIGHYNSKVLQYTIDP